MRKRQCQRFTKRLEVTFSSGDSKFRGISSDLSAGGLFIRTQHGLTPGSIVDMEIYLPRHKVGHLKGIVRRTVKTSLSMVKNGMGIELIERDQNYLDFIKTVYTVDEGLETETESQAPEVEAQKSEGITDKTPESIIVTCPNCKVKNRVSKEKLPLGAKCGRCGTALNTEDKE